MGCLATSLDHYRSMEIGNITWNLCSASNQDKITSHHYHNEFDPFASIKLMICHKVTNI